MIGNMSQVKLLLLDSREQPCTWSRKPRDEFDVGDISLRYISQRVSNPQNGDLAIEWLLVWMGLALCGGTVIVRIRKQEKER